MPREFMIRQEVTLSATPEQVWDVIATEPGLATWFMPMPIDADDAGTEVWQPGSRLLIRTPEAPDGSSNAFEYVIEATDGGTTVLRFAHSGFLGDDWSEEYDAMTGAGWAMYFATMQAYFTHFAGRPATYIEAEGPAASASPDAWPALLAAIVPGGALTLDQQVTIGGGAVGDDDGVVATVDHLSEHFVGLRTPDALIRFHGRSLIDMPVAVSHHAYAPIDAPAATARWKAWLAAAFAPAAS